MGDWGRRKVDDGADFFLEITVSVTCKLPNCFDYVQLYDGIAQF